MQDLFMSYHKLLRRHMMLLILQENQKIAGSNVLTTIWSKSLHHLLESDLQFGYTQCRKNFTKFIKHTVKHADSFLLLDNGPNLGMAKTNKARDEDTRQCGSNKPPFESTVPDSERTEKLRTTTASLGEAFWTVPFVLVPHQVISNQS